MPVDPDGEGGGDDVAADVEREPIAGIDGVAVESGAPGDRLDMRGQEITREHHPPRRQGVAGHREPDVVPWGSTACGAG